PQHASKAVARPRVEPLGATFEAAEDSALPELVVTRRPLGDQEVDLADPLEREQHEDPRLVAHRLPERVVDALDRVVVDLLPPVEGEQPAEQQRVLAPVPARELAAGEPFAIAGSGF